MLDKELIRERFSRAMETYSSMAGMQHSAAERLVDIVSDRFGSGSGAGFTGKRVLEIGCADGLLTRRIIGRMNPVILVANDLCDTAERYVSGLPGVVFLPGDAEKIAFPENMDMIISGSTVQWLDDLPAFFARCADALVPGGILAFSTFGPDNLKEFSQIAGTGLEYHGTGELEGMLSGLFGSIYVVEEHIEMTFGSPAEVLRHLKDTGVTGLRRESWTRGRYADFVRRYSDMFSCAGGVALTWHPVWVTAVKSGDGAAHGAVLDNGSLHIQD